jgi:hypothetical protein
MKVGFIVIIQKQNDNCCGVRHPKGTAGYTIFFSSFDQSNLHGAFETLNKYDYFKGDGSQN